MQRDAKGRFTSTDEKRNTTTKELEAAEAFLKEAMLDNLQDLARLEAAEAFLKEIEFSDIWIVVERDFEDAKAEILKPYLTKSVSKLFQ